MFENPRRGRQATNFTTNVPKILYLKSSSEQIFSENWRWVPLNELPCFILHSLFSREWRDLESRLQPKANRRGQFVLRDRVFPLLVVYSVLYIYSKISNFKPCLFITIVLHHFYCFYLLILIWEIFKFNLTFPVCCSRRKGNPSGRVTVARGSKGQVGFRGKIS